MQPSDACADLRDGVEATGVHPGVQAHAPPHLLLAADLRARVLAVVLHPGDPQFWGSSMRLLCDRWSMWDITALIYLPAGCRGAAGSQAPAAWRRQT